MVTKEHSFAEHDIEFDDHIHQAFEKIRTYFGEEKMVDFQYKGMKEFRGLWNEFFGDSGYMNVLPTVEREEAMQTISLAYVLMEYGHQYQTRKSGEPYVIHPIAVTQEFCVRYKQNAAVVAAGLLHDIVEDSSDPKYRHPITGDTHPVVIEDITELFGRDKKQTPELTSIIDGLTKVRADVKRKEFGKTVKKILEIGIVHPAVIGLKVYDRLHNMRTIQHLPPPKQRRIAWETMGVFGPLAYAGGYIDAYHELLDLSTQVLAQEEDPYYTRKTQELLQQTIPESENNEIIGLLEDMYPLLGRRISTANLHYHELYAWVKSSREHPEYESLHYVPLEIVLKDKKNKFALSRQRDTMLDYIILRDGSPFTIPPNRNIAVSYKYEQYKAGHIDLPTTFFVRYNQAIVPLRVWNISDRQLYRVPLAVKTAVTEDSVSDVMLADEKIHRLKEKLHRIEEVGEHVDAGWLLGSAIEGSMTIEITVGKETRRVPVKMGSRLIDGLLLGADQWGKEIIVNNRVETNIQRALQPDDKIVIPATEPYVDPKWFYSIHTATMCEEEFQERLRIYWEQLPDKDSTKAEQLRGEINHLGHHMFYRPIPEVKDFHPKRVIDWYNEGIDDPGKKIDSETFFFDVALGKIDGTDLVHLRQAFLEYWRSLIIVTLPMPDQAESVVNTLLTLNQRYQIYCKEEDSALPISPLDAITMTFGWNESVNQFIISLRYDPWDINYSCLEQVVTSLKGNIYNKEKN